MDPCFTAVTWLIGPAAIILCIILFRRVEKLSDAVSWLSRRIDELQSAQRTDERRAARAEPTASAPTMHPEPTPRTSFVPPPPAPKPQTPW
ncbi:MAG: hypothetical protein IH624_02735 [Phycisphaerae bacterium]|nr:hypothetical protein [Phycisphaerae bacterium]